MFILYIYICQCNIQFKHRSLFFRSFSQKNYFVCFLFLLSCCLCLFFIILFQSQPTPNMTILASASFEGFWAFAFIVFFCEFGHHVHNSFDDLNAAIDQLNWFRFPLKIQKMLPIIMTGCQHPKSIKGYGDVLCIRDTSKKVKV